MQKSSTKLANIIQQYIKTIKHHEQVDLSEATHSHQQAKEENSYDHIH